MKLDSRKVAFLTIAFVVLGIVVALSVAIPLSLKSKTDYLKQAKKILDIYPLIDG